MPDWGDRVDPDFNFLKDSYSAEHDINPYEHDQYSHGIYKNSQPYDGILLSLSNFEKKIKLTNDDHGQLFIKNKPNVKDYLKIPELSSIKVMGDCGAYSYVAQPEPPEFYSVEHVAEIYSKLKFDLGVSPDHIAIKYFLTKENNKKIYKKVSLKERERRRILTLINSREFINLVHEKRYKFRPIGVAQGYNPSSYEKSVKTLLSQGYDYIALGALVQYNDKEILKILKRIQPFLNGIDLHLFGVLRPNNIAQFQKLGVTSFDSTSYLRKAWLRSGQNYLASNGKWYSAIRVPYSNNKKLIATAEDHNIPLEQLKTLEINAYNSLMKYVNGTLNLNDTLTNVMAYDRLLIRSSKGEEKLEARYRNTLLDKPWEKCSCEICQENGIDVLIFRGTNRNKRRGFHNIWTFRNSNLEFFKTKADEDNEVLNVEIKT